MCVAVRFVVCEWSEVVVCCVVGEEVGREEEGEEGSLVIVL